MLLKQLVFAIGAITAGSLGSMTVSAETPLAGRNHDTLSRKTLRFGGLVKVIPKHSAPLHPK